MLTSRKTLISNLNYVHQQHVSLGVHLSMRSEMMECPVGQDTCLKDVPTHQHQYKDTLDTVLVDANSNDPSVPCQCCDQHSSHAETKTYSSISSIENLDTILCDDYLSPDDLPLSPLSPSSPSTDSSSSSDFTLDDSPVSMYYKEYAHEDLETPDQQPDIIPLDVENLPPYHSDFIDPSNPRANTMAALDMSSNVLKNTVNNNMDTEDVPFIDWSSDSAVDSNCNSLLDTEQPDLDSSSSACEYVDAVVDFKTQPDAAEIGDYNANQTDVPQDFLPSLFEDLSTQTQKKTITSFHELAQKRRRSGGPPQPKKDKSDWLIVFSPDVEHPPLNELTASAFYHGMEMPQAPNLPDVKEVTTFRELRYRNSVNKQVSQQAKPSGSQLAVDGSTKDTDVPPMTELQNNSHRFIGEKIFQDSIEENNELETNKGPARGIQKLNIKLPPLGSPDSPHKLWARNDHQPTILKQMEKHHPSILYNMCSGKQELPTKSRVQPRGMADGGDRRGLEVLGNLPPSRFLFQLSTNLSSPPALLQHGSILQVPQCFALPPQSWYPRLPIRLSPVGASSPPQRSLLPLLSTPDVAILLSPLFPRTRSREMRPQEARTADSSDTGGVGGPLMADGGGDFLQRDKKSLIIAVGSAVDRIISHFNGSRNLVQKTQLGDSRLSPKLGHLILNGLCPSLLALLSDGLKPFQKDVIIGRRKLSPWNVVECSTKSGPESLHILFYNVNQFQQLRDPQRRFNAFIFGLLNTKQLDIWFSHLHQIYDQLSVFYLSTGFLPLAATSCPELHEELLLILQPLSALTFHTDLLFEHHHLPLQDPPTPQGCATPTLADNWGIPPFQHILGLGSWLTHNLAGNADREKANASQTGPSSSSGSQQDGAVHSRNCAKDTENDNRQHIPVTSAWIKDAPETQQSATSKTKDTSTTWWGQLSQATRLYIPANKDSFSFTSFRKSRGTADKPQSQLITQLSSKDEESTDRTSAVEPFCEKDVAELQEQPDQSSIDNAASSISGDEGLTPTHEGSAKCRKLIHENEGLTTPGHAPEKGKWFGQLFGASSSNNRDLDTRTVKSRRPSDWLPPNMNVLNLIRVLSTPEQEQVPHGGQEASHQSDHKPERSLRALCDHSASGEAQLSFRKGDILQLLGTVDEDWIRCRRGIDMGLVPVGYTSLIL